MSNPNESIRYQLDAPMRKVREELGLPADNERGRVNELNEGTKHIILLWQQGIITKEEAREYLGRGPT